MCCEEIYFLLVFRNGERKTEGKKLEKKRIYLYIRRNSESATTLFLPLNDSFLFFIRSTVYEENVFIVKIRNGGKKSQCFHFYVVFLKK